MRAVALVMTMALLAACSTVDSATLLGRDEAFVIKALGTPQFREPGKMPPRDMPGMGPFPRLEPGETYVTLMYTFFWLDEKWYIHLASPAAFERLHGTKPFTTQSDCVLDVQKYPKGVAF